MTRQIGSSYPLHVSMLGPVESYSIYVDLNKVGGIYLRFLLAAASEKNEMVNLIFGPSLKPQMVRVKNIYQEDFQDWQLDNFDKNDLEIMCKEFKVDLLETSLEEFARKTLLAAAIDDNTLVPVPAYRFAGGKSA